MQAAVRDALAKVEPEGSVPRISTPAPPPKPTTSVPRPSARTLDSTAYEAPAKKTAAPPSVIAQAPPPEPPAAENDPRVEAARELFRHVDRLLPSVRQFGWDHPATERALRTAFEGFAETLAKGARVPLTLRPYSLLAHGCTVWEPTAPFDAVPYNLFACGMRTLAVERGITMDELRTLLTLMLLDPVRDLPPEDDLAAAFWEKDLPHVTYEVVDALAEGDASEREAFYGAADAVEAMAAEAARRAATVEAKAMTVTTDRSVMPATGKRARSPMSLDDVVRAVFASQLDVTRDKWSERYVDALIEGYLDAATHRDAPLVLASLRKSAADLVVAGRLEIALQLHDALLARLEQRVAKREDLARLGAALTNALFGAETLELTLKRLQIDPAGIARFEPVLRALWAAELPNVLATLAGVAAGPLRDALMRFVERVAAGHEAEIAAALTGLEPDLACAFVAMLARVGTPEAKRVLGQIAASDDATIRIEAKLVLASSPEQVQAELVQLLDHASALVRMAAQRAVTRHQLRPAWATVARQVKAQGFHELGADERRELLRALVALSPDRGEPMALELVKKGGVFTSEDRETSRALAAEALGALSRAPATAAALREVAQTRWGTSDETRAAAARAAKEIDARLVEVAP
jgi:hypothetical protein